MSGFIPLALALARVLMSSVFVHSAFGKFRLQEEDMKAIGALHLPAPSWMAWTAGTCELAGAMMITLGLGARVAAAMLSLFLLFINLALLRFWEAPDRHARFTQAGAFFGNLGLIGGLLFLMAVGPGSLALVPST